MLNFIRKKLPGTLYLTFIFMAVILTGVMSPEGLGSDENVYLLIVTLEIVAFLLPSIIYCHLHGFEYAKGLELKIPELNKLPIVFSALFAMISLNVLLSLLFAGVSNQPSGSSGSAVGNATVPNGASVIGVIIALCIIPAICEEFVFRSVLMRDYNKYGAKFSIIATALLFSMVHFDLSKFAIYFAGGVLLAMTVYITRSVVCSMLVHALYNIYGMFFEGWFWSSISRNVNLTLIIFISLAVLLVALLVLFSETQRIFIDYSTMGLKAPEGYNKSKSSRDEDLVKALGSYPFVEIGVCVVIFIINLIVRG